MDSQSLPGKDKEQLPVRRSTVSRQGLVIRDLKPGDAGNYLCVATSVGKFSIETLSAVEVKGKVPVNIG